MQAKLFIIILFFVVAPYAHAQILPAEGSELNYRIIGFSSPAQKQAGYKLEIAAGGYKNNDSFKKNIIRSVESKSNTIIGEVPAFGAQYTWRILTFPPGKGGRAEYGAFHHFSTGYIPNVDTGMTRLRLIKQAEKFKDAYVFLDGPRMLCDMNGAPVWYLPLVDTNNGNAVRDLKITPQGTITYEIDKIGAYEVDYSGKVLWKGPDDGKVNGEKKEYYHHEFSRLKNGHYMLLGQEFRLWNPPVLPADTNLVIVPKDKIKQGKTDNKLIKSSMGTLIEYDKKGNVVWSWKSSDHLNGSGIFYRMRQGKKSLIPAHENSFFFDEKSKMIYLSCRDINKIIKIKYPEGDIVSVYSGDAAVSSFCCQHSCSLSREGLLYLYNNNSCNHGSAPSVVMMKEPLSGNDGLETVWEYTCSMDTIYKKREFPTGGNVMELADSSLFVSMAYPGSSVFIVNMNKEIVWRAVAEKWNEEDKKWEPDKLYRASIVPGRKELEKLVWSGK